MKRGPCENHGTPYGGGPCPNCGLTSAGDERRRALRDCVTAFEPVLTMFKNGEGRLLNDQQLTDAWAAFDAARHLL